MKKIVIMLLLSLILTSCGAPPAKPEGMSDEQYSNMLETIENAKVTIKEEKDVFPTEAYIDLGLNSQVLLDYDTAEDAYKKVLENDPVNYLGLNNLASMYEEMGKTQESLELFGKLADANPENFEAIKDTLRLFKTLKRNDDGQTVLEHWITNYPSEKKDDKFLQFSSQMFIFISEK